MAKSKVERDGGKSKAFLSHEETMQLIKESQAGNKKARDILIERNIKLVWNIIHKFKGHEHEDLFQIGCIGLMKAIDKFDDSFDVRFSTYAVPVIKGEIQRFVRDNGQVKVSRSIKDAANKIRRLNLENYNDIFYVANILETDNMEFVKSVIEYLTSFYVASMEETVYSNNDGEDVTLKDQLSGDVNSSNWFDNIALKDAIKHLTEREALIIQMRFFKDMTQTEVANKIGISQVQVSRLETKIITKLKNLMEVKDDSPKIEIDKTIKTKKKEGIKMSVLVGQQITISSTLAFIFKNYPELTPAEISNLTGFKYTSVNAIKSKYGRGKLNNIKFEINPELQNKIKKYIDEKIIKENIEIDNRVYTEPLMEPQPKTIFEPEAEDLSSPQGVELPNPCPRKIILPYKNTDKVEEIINEKSIILKNQITHMSNKEEIILLIESISSMISKMPDNSEIDLKMDLTVFK